MSDTYVAHERSAAGYSYPLSESAPLPNKRHPDPIDAYVGCRLQMRRAALRLSQTILGDSLGITFQQVQKYEKGKNRISASRLQHIARLLDVPISFFFDGGPDQTKIPRSAPSSQFVSDFLATRDGLALTRAFARLPGIKLRRTIVALVEQIADTKT